MTALTAPPRKTTFADVFAVRDFRALWAGQLLSVTGDQFARIAVAVLVFDRTRSALLTALTLTVSVLPGCAGGLTICRLADRYPRRAVMITSDLISAALVAAMLIPGMPLPALVGLLFAVAFAGSPFMAARSATNRAALGDRFQLGNAVTQTTYQAAQVAGLGAGGILAGLAGARGALAIDAATFAASAALITAWVERRPAPARPGQAPSAARIVAASPAARTALGLECLVCFLVAAEGIAVPLSRELGGGPAATGLLLAAMTAGAAAGPVLYGRLVGEARRVRCAGPLAAAACAVLLLFALRPPLAAALAILAASSLGTAFMVATGGVFADAIPDAARGGAFGIANGVLLAGQAAVMLGAGALAAVIGPARAIAVFAAAGCAAAVPLTAAWARIARRQTEPEPAASPPA